MRMQYETLLCPQRRGGIGRGGAPGRDRARQSRYDQEDQRHRDERRQIEWRDAEEERLQPARGDRGDNHPGRQSEQRDRQPLP